MYTIEEIRAMTPDQLKAVNKELQTKLAKRFALRVGVGIAVAVAVHYVAKKFETDTVEDTTPAE